MITLKGNPLSTNNVYPINCVGKFPRKYISPKGRALKEDYFYQVKQQWKDKPLEGNLEIQVKLFFGDKRVRDWDNFHKLSMDALSGIVWVDDSQIQMAHVCKHYDKENPRIEIDIIEIEIHV